MKGLLLLWLLGGVLRPDAEPVFQGLADDIEAGLLGPGVRVPNLQLEPEEGQVSIQAPTFACTWIAREQPQGQPGDWFVGSSRDCPEPWLPQLDAALERHAARNPWVPPAFGVRSDGKAAPAYAAHPVRQELLTVVLWGLLLAGGVWAAGSEEEAEG